MEQVNKITVSGDLGGGKSVTCKLIAESIGLKYVSTGLIQRDIARNKNMTTLELNKHAETHPEIDKEIDSLLHDLRFSSEALIIDSRMAWHFVPDSFKVCLQIDINIAMDRIMSDKTRHNESYSSKENAIRSLRERKESEVKRFLIQYGVDISHLENYDLIIDTSYSAPEQVASIIIEKYLEWKKGLQKNKYWFSPLSLYTTQSVRSLGDENAKFVLESVMKHGFDFNYPIEVIKKGDYYFIWDGHRRTSAAIRQRIPYIPIKILARDDEQVLKNLSANKFIETSFNLSWVYDWESAHNFRHKVYPFTINEREIPNTLFD